MIDANAAISAPDTDTEVVRGDPYSLELADGLTIGKTTYRKVTLRDLTARDVLEAQAEAERVVRSGGNVLLVGSPARMGVELLRRQVKHLEEDGAAYQGPLSVDDLGRLSVRDLDRLRAAADALDVYAALKNSERIETRGRDAGGDA